MYGRKRKEYDGFAAYRFGRLEPVYGGIILHNVKTPGDCAVLEGRGGEDILIETTFTAQQGALYETFLWFGAFLRGYEAERQKSLRAKTQEQEDPGTCYKTYRPSAGVYQPMLRPAIKKA